MRSGNDPIVAIVAIMFVVLAAWISRAIGADFTVVLLACAKTLIPVIIAGVLVGTGYMRLATASLGALVIIYPLWWPVMDNVAHNLGQVARVGWDEYQLPWWCSNWFKLLTELALIAAVAWWYITGRDY